MKKVLYTLPLLLFFSILSAQKAVYRLHDIESSDLLDKVTFYYRNDQLLSWFDLTTPDGGTSLDVRDSLKYDDRGNIITINTYQKINDEWFHCCVVDYTYDDNNNRITRTNYNDLGTGLEKHGVYTYTYDENNRLIHHDLELVGNPIERSDYTYNEKGLLEEELSETFFDNIWENSARTTYVYDDDNNLTNIYYAYWDNGSWYTGNSTVLTYDEASNCLSRTYYTDNTITDRIYYTYDLTIDMNDVIMPAHPEPFYRRFDQFRNRPESYSWETVDENYILHYITDFNFHYDQLETNSTTGVAENSLDIYPNPASDQFAITVPGLKTVELLDIQGKNVKKIIAGQDNVRIDVSALSSGIYVVRAFDGKNWKVGKLVVE